MRFIDRRNFLKASLAGASLAYSPSLLAQTQTKNPVRFIFLRKSNGFIPENFALPSFSAKEKEMDLNKEALEVKLNQHKLPAFFNPIESLKENMTILQGLSGKMTGPHGHGPRHSIFTLHKKNRSNSDLIRASLDFEIAKLTPSPFTHLGFSAASQSMGMGRGFSVKAPGQSNFEYYTPRTAFRDIFNAIAETDEAQKDFELKNKFLKFTESRQKHKSDAKMSELEARKFNSYRNSILALYDKQLTLSNMKDKLKKYKPQLSQEFLEDKPSTSKRQVAHAEIAVASLRAGLTNVVNIDLDSNQSVYVDLGMEGHIVHNVGHGRKINNFSAHEARAIINEQHCKVISLMVDKLKQTPEGDGNMFDNTFILYITDSGEKHHSEGFEFPTVIISGKNIPLSEKGKYIRYPYYMRGGHETLGNFFTSMLNAFGNPIEHFGDLDPKLQIPNFDQTGAIKGLFS